MMNPSTPRSASASSPGPRGVQVPDLSRKLTELCDASGRNAEWLARCLACSPPSVTHWRRVGRMPPDRLLALCALFGISQDLLLEPDLDVFLTAMRERLSLGSGERWAALLTRAMQTDAPGLSLEIRGGVPLVPEPGLRGVRTVVRPKVAHHFPTVFTNQALRFRLDAHLLPAGFDWRPDRVVMVVESPTQELDRLCPSRMHPTLAAERDAWMLPAADGQPLVYDDQFGLHQVIAVVSSEPMPGEIVEQLWRWEEGPQMRMALDGLAYWLSGGQDAGGARSGVRHVVWSRRFVLRPAIGSGP